MHCHEDVVQEECDIGVLDCSKSYTATTWLEIAKTKLKKGVTVDLLGYPGRYDALYLKRIQNCDVSVEDEREVMELLPRWELIVSDGEVIDVGANTTYKLSTIGGMSGGPVVMNGKAVGQFVHCQGTYLIGVHIGGNILTHNRCVPFTNKWAAKLISERLEGKSSKRFLRSLIPKFLHGRGSSVSHSDGLSLFPSHDSAASSSLVDVLAVTVAEEN